MRLEFFIFWLRATPFSSAMYLLFLDQLFICFIHKPQKSLQVCLCNFEETLSEMSIITFITSLFDSDSFLVRSMLNFIQKHVEIPGIGPNTAVTVRITILFKCNMILCHQVLVSFFFEF